MCYLEPKYLWQSFVLTPHFGSYFLSDDPVQSSPSWDISLRPHLGPSPPFVASPRLGGPCKLCSQNLSCCGWARRHFSDVLIDAGHWMDPSAAHEGQGLSCGSSSCAESVLTVGNKLLPCQHPFRDLQFQRLPEEVCRNSDQRLPVPVFYSNSRPCGLPAASASGSKRSNTVSRHTVRAAGLARLPSISSNYSISRNIPMHIYMQEWVGRDIWGVAGWLLRKWHLSKVLKVRRG